MALRSTHMGQRVGDIRPTLPVLPMELWLQILEQADHCDACHLWSSVRLISLHFKDYVERHFISAYLPDVTIFLALPRRDPATDTLKWPGDPIPRSRIIFSFDSITADQQCAILISSEALGPPGEMKSVDELRRTGSLPEERLQQAPPWVNIGKNHLTGISVGVKGTFFWDNDRKIWAWRVNWRKLVTHFYQAKTLKRGSTSTGKHRIQR
jgi:hypothetical protein